MQSTLPNNNPQLLHRLPFLVASFALFAVDMVDQNSEIAPEDTRERLLDAALEQFADRGYYGASIAQIAGEVGLTKQALLYHFKRKEDLYSEVLRRISGRLQTGMRTKQDASKPPREQFEDMMLGLYQAAIDNPFDIKVMLRELIDDQRRDAPESEWHFKAALGAMVAMLDNIEGLSELPFAEKIARIYMVVSAAEFFAGSGSVLRRFYGEEEYLAIRSAYPDQLRELVNRLTKTDLA